MFNKVYNILLIGDNCRDVYQYGYVDRLSPEAPVPVFRFDHETTRPGMAGNVFENLNQFACTVNYLYDQTSVKTRLIDIRSGQHIVRIDNDVISDPIATATNDFHMYDAVVISDYNKGTVSYELIEYIHKYYMGPMFVDTKKTDLARLDGCFVKINNLEFRQAKTLPKNLIVTDGRNGATYQGNQTFPAPEIEVVDTCGAGDTFLAALTFGFLNNDNNIEEAIRFANRAAAITVSHSGVYAPSMEEICDFLV